MDRLSLFDTGRFGLGDSNWAVCAVPYTSATDELMRLTSAAAIFLTASARRLRSLRRKPHKIVNLALSAAMIFSGERIDVMSQIKRSGPCTK